MDTTIGSFSDGDEGRIYGHFSEVIPSVLAAGEKQRASGRDTITAIAIGYEFLARFGRAAGGSSVLEQHGIKGEVFAALVVPIVVGKLLKLAEKQIVNAVGIAGCYAGALALLDDAWEEQSMARNLRFPANAHSAIVAALMAEHGFEGPSRVIEGRNGFIETLLRGQFDLAAFNQSHGGAPHKWANTTWTKTFPVSVMLQSQTEALIGLVTGNLDLIPERIAKVTITTTPDMVAKGDHSVYRFPATKEAADKSPHYVAALAIVDRDIGFGTEQFTAPRLADPALHRLMDRIHLIPSTLRKAPHGSTEVEVLTVDGTTYRSRVEYPKGHPQNPLSDSELKDKFAAAAGRLMSRDQMHDVFARIDHLDELGDIRDFAGSLVLH